MAEEQEEGSPSGTGRQARSASADPSALAFALSGASREKVDAFLEKQTSNLDDQRVLTANQIRMLHLQMEEMRAEEPYKFSHFRLRRFSGWAKAAFELSAGLLALAVTAGMAFLIWNAASSNDLVIDSFQVPPDLAVRGLSGPVVAAKLSDRIAAIQTQTTSARAPRSYAKNLGEGLKLEIPETGVSLSELDRFLRAKLGHDLHIGGEMVETPKGITITARAGSDSATVTGAEADMDGLLQKLAEQVYRATQPYRYGVWLQLQGRVDEGVAVLKPLTAGGPPSERAWAYNGLAVITSQRESQRAGMVLLRRGVALDPNLYLLSSNMAGAEFHGGREEDSVRDYQAALTALVAHGRDYVVPERITIAEHTTRQNLLSHQGALLEAAQENRIAAEATLAMGAAGGLGRPARAQLLALLHEPTAARASLADVPPLTAASGNVPNFLPSLTIALEEQDWPGVLAAEKDFMAIMALFPGMAENRHTWADPSIALALAHMGNFMAAEGRLKPMPADCYPCLRARAQVAAIQAQEVRADWWFARAAAAAPTAPFAESEWGRALLHRKQPDAAIAHFTAANKIGPHFADPLEGWGEALMAKNQSHLALAKFAEADKYAPNWGRLHLKWGEALGYAGKPDEAKKQFVLAAGLDLTPGEKAELARQPLHA